MTLAGKVALVTGGSRGIGRAICLNLAKAGADVYVNYTSNSSAAEETVQACKALGVNAWALQFDVASSESVDAAFDQIKSQSTKLDILVNNAGIAHDGVTIRVKDDDWNRVLATNLSGAFYCARAAAKMMMKQRSGRIVNISSVVGEMGNPGQAAYVSSKSGLIGLTKSLAKELASREITVNAVTPGFIETDMTQDLDPRLKEEHFKAIPLSRYGQADDVAAAVVFLSGAHAGYITGQILGVNGGMYM
jgi:3-oxoacyl-[acyl-carrier protein] reductase